MGSMESLEAYVPLALLLVVGFLLSLVMVGITRIMGPRRTTDIKTQPFESGSVSVGSARERFSVKFYMVALLFIVFDVEAVFVYPWAVNLATLGWPAMVTMLVFMATLIVGFVYVWKKGALEWS